jgi:hypothetical protein
LAGCRSSSLIATSSENLLGHRDVKAIHYNASDSSPKGTFVFLFQVVIKMRAEENFEFLFIVRPQLNFKKFPSTCIKFFFRIVNNVFGRNWFTFFTSKKGNFTHQKQNLK